MHFHSGISCLDGNSGLHFPRVLVAGCQALWEKGGQVLLYGNEDLAGLKFLLHGARAVLLWRCVELLHCSLLKRVLFESLYLYQQIKGRAVCQLETSRSPPLACRFTAKSLLGGMDLFYMHLIPL